jgi:hypothetical protein
MGRRSIISLTERTMQVSVWATEVHNSKDCRESKVTYFLSLDTLELVEVSALRSEVLSVLVLARGASDGPEET